MFTHYKVLVVGQTKKMPSLKRNLLLGKGPYICTLFRLKGVSGRAQPFQDNMWNRAFSDFLEKVRSRMRN